MVCRVGGRSVRDRSLTTSGRPDRRERALMASWGPENGHVRPGSGSPVRSLRPERGGAGPRGLWARGDEFAWAPGRGGPKSAANLDGDFGPWEQKSAFRRSIPGGGSRSPCGTNAYRYTLFIVGVDERNFVASLLVTRARPPVRRCCWSGISEAGRGRSRGLRPGVSPDCAFGIGFRRAHWGSAQSFWASPMRYREGWRLARPILDPRGDPD